MISEHIWLNIIKDMEKKDIIRRIYEALPKLNCGFCGFGNCGQFARAVVEGRVSPFGCRQNPGTGYRISEIIGMRVPTYSYGFQPAFGSRAGVAPLLKTVREETLDLSQKTDDILVRIERIRARK